MAFLMMPSLANDLKAYGFATKQAVYEYWVKATSITIGQYKTYGWWDNRTAGGENIEPISKKKYKDLPNDYVVPVAGSASEQVIFVCGGLSERTVLIQGGRGSVYPIDPWR
jgi:hypothetical protein